MLPILASFALIHAFSEFSSEPNLLINPRFEEGLSGWELSAGDAEIATGTGETGSYARIRYSAGTRSTYPSLFQTFAVQPGDLLETRVTAKGREVSGGYGVYTSLGYYNVSGERLSFVQSDRVEESDVWTLVPLAGVVPEGAASARFALVMNGRGEADFDDAVLVRRLAAAPIPDATEVSVQVTGREVCASLIGFGAEDDGWFYNEKNAELGVDETDAATREERILWMDPDWVRMFFWHGDWCPSGDWKTFTFDSENMRSHYRALDLYQRIGATVNVVGVEWAMKDPYAEPQLFAEAVGALLEHLIRNKGYTCVRQWTFTNEPNHSFLNQGYRFDRYVEIHKAAASVFKRRGLMIDIVGSDDADGVSWFARCAGDPKYRDIVAIMASHRYFKGQDRAFVPRFFEDRFSVLAKAGMNQPFVVAEFGFQDGRSGTFENPLMESYPYALWTTDFAIRGLNRGVAGFSIWCLHEMAYPLGGLMNYGLWEHKRNRWKTRPVYHAWSQFTRLTEAGQASIECVSSRPDQFQAAKVGGTLFWVHHGAAPTAVRVENLNLGRVRIHTEDTLAGDRESGTDALVEGNSFVAPPRSFGYAQPLD